MAGLIHAIKLFQINKTNTLSFLTKNANFLKQFHTTSGGLKRSFGLKDRSSLLLKSSIGLGTVTLGTAYYLSSSSKGDSLFNSGHLEGLFKAIQSLFFKYAECEVEKQRNRRRTDHYEKTVSSKEPSDENSKNKEPAFDWHLFWQMIYKEKLYFIAAIAVSILEIHENIYSF
jgi:hypothetical protein